MNSHQTVLYKQRAQAQAHLQKARQDLLKLFDKARTGSSLSKMPMQQTETPRCQRQNSKKKVRISNTVTVYYFSVDYDHEREKLRHAFAIYKNIDFLRAVHRPAFLASHSSSTSSSQSEAHQPLYDVHGIAVKSKSLKRHQQWTRRRAIGGWQRRLADMELRGIEAENQREKQDKEKKEEKDRV